MSVLSIVSRKLFSSPLRTTITRSITSQASFVGLRAVAVFGDGTGFGINQKGDLVVVTHDKGRNNGNAAEALPPSERAVIDEADLLKRVDDCDMWIERPSNGPNNRGNTPWMKPQAPRYGAANFSTLAGGNRLHSLSPWYQQSARFSSLSGDGLSGSASSSLPISLVIFDKDGTLIDCNSVWLPWMEAHVKELEQLTGMKLSEQLYSAVGYCPKEKEYKDEGLLAHATVADIKNKFKEVLSDNGMGHSEASDLVDGCCPDFDSGSEDTLTPLGDLTNIFKTLRRDGVKTAVCTMDSRYGTMTALDSLGLTSMVDMIVCGDDFSSKPKPAPDNALNICKALDVCPTETVVVGDTTADTGMGKSAGLGLIVGVKTGAGSSRALEEQSHIVLNSVDEFLSSVYYKRTK